MPSILDRIAAIHQRIRENTPIVHQITNYVTVNDCANITLAIGASPIMADDVKEVGEIVEICNALVLNIGTLNARTIDSMLLAGKRANALGIPVVLDPVGVGASTLRSCTAERIIREVKLSVLRGNLSEISVIAGLSSVSKGVDASEEDIKSHDGRAIACALAQKLDCAVAITGAIDIIAQDNRVISVANGHPMLSKVTGTGCMTTALTGAYCAVAGGDSLAAAVGAILSMGIAGEMAFAKAGDAGTGSFRVALTDAISLQDKNTLYRRAKIDETACGL